MAPSTSARGRLKKQEARARVQKNRTARLSSRCLQSRPRIARNALLAQKEEDILHTSSGDKSSQEVQIKTWRPSTLPNVEEVKDYLLRLLKLRDTRNKSKTLERSISNAISSPLLLLPAEIRNEIYVYCLKASASIELWQHTSSLHTTSVCMNLFNTTYEIPAINMLFTCRQINAEAQLFLYSLNRFQFFWVGGARNWLSNRTPAQTRAIAYFQPEVSWLWEYVREGWCIKRILPGLKKLLVYSYMRDFDLLKDPGRGPDLRRRLGTGFGPLLIEDVVRQREGDMEIEWIPLETRVYN